MKDMAPNGTVIASSRAPFGAKACVATQLNKSQSDKKSFLQRRSAKSYLTGLPRLALLPKEARRLAMTVPLGAMFQRRS